MRNAVTLFLAGLLLRDFFVAGTSIEPNLPFGDINVLVLTDVHSWIGSHRHQEPMYDADYGDILSFYEQLKAHCDEMVGDLWFVSNGDWVHGTGLSAGGDVSALVPMLEKMPWDAVNCGNHELYETSIVEYMMRPGGFVDWWGDRYLTANVLRAQEDRKPLGHHYKVLKGTKSDLMVFGFLYNLENPSSLIEVAKVEEVVKEKWFTNALKNEEFDAILILAHMDLVDPLVDVIRTAIRVCVGEMMPIQFITGHTHYRGVVTLDDTSTSFEAGRYLDTVGFVSFPTVGTVSELGKENATGLFKSVFLDSNKQNLTKTLNVERLTTRNGYELSTFISKTRNKKGLLEEVGCAPQDYIINAALDDERSIWGLYRDEVIPKMFFSFEDTDEFTSVMFLSKESWRYDILSTTTLVVDDVWAVAPFNDTVTYLGIFSGDTLLLLNISLNEDADPWNDALPNYIMIGSIEDQEKEYKLYTHDFHTPHITAALNIIVPNQKIEPEPTAYTSTIIWLSFVMENWACNGMMGKLPDWFPTPDHVTKQLGRGDDDGMERAIAIVLVVFFGLVLCSCLACCWIWVRYICSGHQALAQDELDGFKDAFKMDHEEDHEKQTENTFTDDDHEML
jgi:2',3'-cyclic-nucleotide 2'-phosphodiesterase (5'-nucleotidase family)